MVKKRSKKRIDRKTVLVLIILTVFFILFAKLVYVQIFLHGKISRAVRKMVNRENIEVSRRGDILDSKGKVLASSVKKYSVFLDPKIIKDFDRVKNVLAENGIKIKEKSLVELGETSYVPVAFNIDADVVDRIKNEKLKGVGFESKYVRQYPEGRLLAHILGIMGYDGNGLEGIEKTYNESLSGNTVMTKTIRDGRGRIIQSGFADAPKICGQDVILSIDRTVQFIAEQELREAFDKHKAKKAICIVQDPKTGNILAMVSLPDFDSSEKIRDIRVLRNSAISDIYEPGSTFKIVAIAAALELGKIKFTDSFYLENGKYKIAGHTIKDDHKISGSASLCKIMEQSSNIGMIKIAQKLDRENFYEYIKKFGFYSLTGIDLPGEAKGLLMDVKKWNALSLPTISFGQGIGVTALQLINAFSAIANDGVLMKPSLMQDIRRADSETASAKDAATSQERRNVGETDDEMTASVFDLKEIRRVVSVETAQMVKKLLKNVVDFGTGRSAKVPGYTMGGKTGTAQKVDPTIKTYSAKYYTASFCGMLPAMNPKVVILVVIDEPKGSSYYATSVASPVFAKIAKRIAEYLGIEKDDVDKLPLQK
ncbi:peptidoglycan D,D-transpeptidase FtsI family protein [Candidatus Endomicrobiellum agilis]|uniref:peptidoglycan D,D-transpeptidase FtsI family protein n=1 Tax=Candidatus Endomicrobiellum agilis TaxID=3238957 RepID=UPI0035A8E63E